MAKIGSKDTKPELMLRRALWASGLRGWRCHRKLPGKPDLAFGPSRVAVFVDGAFWHGHPDKFTFGKSGEFWDTKIKRNQERDREVDTLLMDSGWTVLRFWDFEVEGNPADCVEAVTQAVESAKRGEPTQNRLNWEDKTLPA